MVEKDLVSVIIPTYNRNKIVKRAIKSVLFQSYQKFEIIIIDDASIDNTEEGIKSIGDERIRYFRNKINIGPGASRNKGIDNAKGKWIAFLDSDDFWLPKKLELQLQAIKKEKHPEKTLLYSRTLCYFDHFFKPYPKKGYDNNKNLLEYFLESKLSIQTSSVLLSRQVKERFSTNRNIREDDLEYFLRLKENGLQIKMIHPILVIYSKEKDSVKISTSKNKYLPPYFWAKKSKYFNRKILTKTYHRNIHLFIQLETPKKKMLSLVFNAFKKREIDLINYLILIAKILFLNYQIYSLIRKLSFFSISDKKYALFKKYLIL